MAPKSEDQGKGVVFTLKSHLENPRTSAAKVKIPQKRPIRSAAGRAPSKENTAVEELISNEEKSKVGQSPEVKIGRTKDKKHEYKNPSPGRYRDEATAAAFPAIHHMYQDIYSDTKEEEEARISYEELAYDEKLKRDRKIRQRTGELEPEGWDGTEKWQKARRDQVEELKAIRKRRKIG